MNIHTLKHMKIIGQNLPSRKKGKLRQIHKDGTIRDSLKTHTCIKIIKILNISIRIQGWEEEIIFNQFKITMKDKNHLELIIRRCSRLRKVYIIREMRILNMRILLFGRSVKSQKKRRK